MYIEYYSALISSLEGWWSFDEDGIAIIISAVISGLRMACINSSWKLLLLESLLCSLLTFTILSSFEYFCDLNNKSLSISIGGCVGLIGGATIRTIIMSVIQLKTQINDKTKLD